MRTSELIAALAADPVPEPVRVDRRVAIALVVGLAVSVALYFLLLGPRPDLAAAAETMRFWLKVVDSFAFALPSLLLTLRLARPDAKPRALALWLLAPFILLAAGVVAEMLLVPQSEWMSRLVGANRCTARSRSRCWPLRSCGVHRRVASRRAAPPGVDRRNGRGGRGRGRGAGLRFVLPRRFAALRRDLVSARNARLHGRGRARRAAVSGVVKRAISSSAGRGSP